MPENFTTPALLATFRSDQAAKLELARGATMLVGLNCFEPGQAQSVHSHGGADKFYFIISGNASMVVGGEARDAGPGTLIWAPAGVPHGVERAHERTVMLVGIAPPPHG
ncbi:MAG TPA: cupin domain-containing protein [Gemmatimonadales bacterium]|jgi:mannose-6-phosphate isomerase-like protein (cupin superfamily)|nr:cupin domain-containing protein [Gemmatimonadales bacterium]